MIDATVPKAELDGLGIDLVLNVADELPPCTAEGVECVKKPLRKFTDCSPSEVEYAVEALRSCMRQDRSVLVHCCSGQSRAPFVALVYLRYTNSSLGEGEPLTDAKNNPVARWLDNEGCRIYAWLSSKVPAISVRPELMKVYSSLRLRTG